MLAKSNGNETSYSPPGGEFLHYELEERGFECIGPLDLLHHIVFINPEGGLEVWLWDDGFLNYERALRPDEATHEGVLKHPNRQGRRGNKVVLRETELHYVSPGGNEYRKDNGLPEDRSKTGWTLRLDTVQPLKWTR